jgi:type IV pilus assembly protein PilE
MSLSRLCLPSVRSRGFSLIELMIAVSVLAIVMSLALPSFFDSLRKGRRSDAVQAIAAVQQAQERFRGANPTYSDNLTAAPNASPPGLGLSVNTPNGHYTLELSTPPAAGTYIVTATAQGSQAADTQCAKMAARIIGGVISYGSGSTSVNWSDPKNCWAK